MVSKNNATYYQCSNCGTKSNRWQGKCLRCGAWNTLEEKSESQFSDKVSAGLHPINFTSINAIESEIPDRLLTKNFPSLDRVFGGGLVEGSVTLLGGNPGAGKSTLLLQYAHEMTEHGKVYYLSGEESATQIADRARRINLASLSDIFISSLDDISSFLHSVSLLDTKPVLIIVDSIQTVGVSGVDLKLGSVSQVQAVVQNVVDFCKNRNIPALLVGHVTKEGSLAGPRTVEHMVDTVLYLSGEQEKKMLKSVKNRFGAIHEVAIFNFDKGYFIDTPEIASLVRGSEDMKKVGAVCTMAREGSHLIPLEVQALVVSTYSQYPRRVISGYDYNRVLLLLAVMTKYLRTDFTKFDVFVSVSEGVKITETAGDLAVLMALYSSLVKAALPQYLAAWGEVNLLGEVLDVPQEEQRRKFANQLGFLECISATDVKNVLSLKGKSFRK